MEQNLTFAPPEHPAAPSIATGNAPLSLTHPLQTGGPDPGGGAGEILLSAGLYEQRVTAAGLTVARVRSRFRARFSIDDRAVAVVDGVEAAPETVLQAGQTLTFVRRAGERG